MAENIHTLLSMELPAVLESLPAFSARITGCAKEAGFGERKLGAMELAVEEAIVNIVKYSSSSPDSVITATCGTDGSGAFYITIIDSGPPFDPLERDTPDTRAGIDDRPVGGLGIFFIKEMTDGVTYNREAGKNILTIKMKKQ
ncbi:MAG: Serine-protein kinase RsbW [Syntrophorhabdus sp. PtaB.Bin184]|jgi:serine/threonine-protein kinase RsbW|nr:MAG: Serine-protein kinase RsbW [Syntrophorhabdus sp. PtaB.Bin184]